ncbi:hypothetical protein [Parvularcula marina]|uniref:hypothetical protein n=1 Tax=Parvularcula marina TaxID=2292771 RepID=UPI003519C13C
MKMISSLRGGLLLTSACAVLAACSGSGSVENAGNTGSVTINPGNGGGGGQTTADGAVDFTTQLCPDGTTEGTRTVGGVDITACIIPAGTLLTDTTLEAGNAYALDGTVFVGNSTFSAATGIAPGTQVTLNIEPGVVVFGLNGEDALVVSPGSQINAVGSPSQPIIFTSAADLIDADQDGTDLSAMEAVSDGVSGGSSTARGQWGGIVINGLAPINDCEDGTIDPVVSPELCVKDGEGGSGLYGGSNPADNSGTLQFVRVQYAGFLFSTDDELNGIAFQGVGNMTTVDNIQVHNNADDGVEFFGGTVNATHVVVTGAGDDSIDWTDGWQGNIQYALVVQTPGDANRGFEGDNRGNDNAIRPQSMPNIANFTLTTDFGNNVPGPDANGDGPDDGAKLREGTGGFLANGIIVGFQGQGIDFDVPGDFTPANPAEVDPRPTLDSIFLADNNGGAFDSAGRTLTAMNIVEAAGSTLNGVFSGSAEQAVAAADLSGLAGFDNVDYIGAFSDSETAISNSWLAGWTLVSNAIPDAANAACPTGTTLSSNPVPAGRSEARVCTLPTVVSADTRLVGGNLYELDGSVFVGTDAGPDASSPFGGAVQVALTIDPGVTLYGLNGEDALIVTRGSQLFSNGTEGAPVVMTSLADLNGTATATTRGQWGGVVINGRAPINDCEVGTVDPVANPEQCEKDGEGGSGLFGGNEPTDNSGRLTYTQVRYAGFLFSTDDELNGIAFQGVGSDTEVDYIQVHNNSDDGVEFFGGTVNAKHVVITGAGDDSIDWTDGWTGNIQYAIVVQTEGDANRGFEGDNRGNDNAIEPQSNPWIRNFTLTTNFGGSVPGPDANGDGPDDGMKLREGTAGQMSNGVVVGFDGEGLDFDAPADFTPTYPVETGPRPTVLSTYLANNGDDGDGNVDLGDSETIFNADSENVAEDVANPLVADSDGTSATLILQAPNALAITPVNTDRPSAPGFFDTVDYIGAIRDDADNWYVGWTFSL